ncbi:hypothetical protein EUGRSUZ_D01286 [Eucalyptus grandis]|uniref:Uncharacterized protein n=2 Tax=Eucalyptus grandis TaxID=71139 RepID=A0A059CFD8_EUCGR|nr:hypothetical protein EUGRSUZ_D01286 [Eucalyptus grandis]
MATPKTRRCALDPLPFLFVSISVEARDVKERRSFSRFTNANDIDDKENARVIPTKEQSLTTTTTTTTGSRATNDRNNYTGGNRYRAMERQGMSDTRYMENGN